MVKVDEGAKSGGEKRVKSRGEKRGQVRRVELTLALAKQKY